MGCSTAWTHPMQHKHKWYYFPAMTKDEVLLFKQFDSDTSLTGRMAFHTAIKDPTAHEDSAKKNSTPRELIECRAICFFPGVEPNSCPATLSEDDDAAVSLESADIDTLARRMISDTLAYAKTAEGEQVFRQNVKGLWNNGSAAGVDKCAEVWAADPQGYYKISKASKEDKARLKAALLKRGLGEALAEIFESLAEKDKMSAAGYASGGAAAPAIGLGQCISASIVGAAIALAGVWFSHLGM